MSARNRVKCLATRCAPVYNSFVLPHCAAPKFRGDPRSCLRLAVNLLSCFALLGCGSAATDAGSAGADVADAPAADDAQAAARASCAPANEGESCAGNRRIGCQIDAANASVGKWVIIADCAAGERCVELEDPASVTKKHTICKGDLSDADAAASAVDDAEIGTDSTAENGTDLVPADADDSAVDTLQDSIAPPDAAKDAGLVDAAAEISIDSAGETKGNAGDSAKTDLIADMTMGQMDSGSPAYFCDKGCGKATPSGVCSCAESCAQNGDCCDATGTKKAGKVCAGSTCAWCNGIGPVCGNGVCDPTESVTKCAKDCPATACGNGSCEVGETTDNCPKDCAMPPMCMQYSDVQPILAAKCGSCHSTYGGTDCGQVASKASNIVGMINGSMPPPGMPQLTDAEKALIKMWVAAGAPCDDSACGK